MKNNKNEEISPVLLVEDELAHAELIMRVFEDHPAAANIYHVPDGEAALDYLFRQGSYTDPEQSPRPHLILLDLHLPKIDGLEVLKTIKSSADLQQIPVVILTTSRAKQDVTRAYKAHANSYLVKPIDFDQFVQLIQEVGFYWLNSNYYPWE